MRPFPADLMRMWPISTRVNKPENDDPSIIEPIELRTDAACGHIRLDSIRRVLHLFSMLWRLRSYPDFVELGRNKMVAPSAQLALGG